MHRNNLTGGVAQLPSTDVTITTAQHETCGIWARSNNFTKYLIIVEDTE